MPVPLPQGLAKVLKSPLQTQEPGHASGSQNRDHTHRRYGRTSFTTSLISCLSRLCSRLFSRLGIFAGSRSASTPGRSLFLVPGLTTPRGPLHRRRWLLSPDDWHILPQIAHFSRMEGSVNSARAARCHVVTQIGSSGCDSEYSMTRGWEKRPRR